MRLLKRVAGVEHRQEEQRARRARAAAAWQLVWTSDDARLDPASSAGLAVAVDVFADRATVGGVVLWRCVERYSREPGDLGSVYDVPSGEVVGRVVRADADIVEVEYARPVGLPARVRRRKESAAR